MADSLKDIASQINRDRISGITKQDLEKFAEKIAQERDKNAVDPKELANSIARSTALAVASHIPSPKDFLSAIVNANPLLSAGVNIFGKLSGTLKGLMDESRGSRNAEVEKLSQAIEELRAKEDEISSAKENGQTELLPVLNEQLLTMKRILDELTDVYKLQEKEQAENATEKLQSLDTDAPEEQKITGLEKAEGLLKKMIENQERSFMLDMVGTVKGIFGTVLSALTGMLGGLVGGGILGKIIAGGKTALKLAGKLTFVASAIYEFYEGFTSAEKFFKDEGISFFDKVRYAVTHMVSSLIAPIDWAVEFITGEESNLREKFETSVINLQNKALEFLQPLFDGFGWLKDQVMKVFEGTDLDTKLVDIPEIIAENIKDMILGAWGNLVNMDIPGKVKSKIDEYVKQAVDFGESAVEKFDEGVDFAKQIKDSVLESIKNFFVSTFDSFLEYMATEVENAGLFGIGGKAAETLRSLKTTSPDIDAYSRPDAKNVGVGATGYSTYQEAMKSEVAREAQKASVQQSPAPQMYHPQQAVNPQTSVYAPVNNNSSTTVISRGMTTRPERELVPDF